jgi:hypothetical protein
MRVAILAYHSQNIAGREYGSNDHVALREDLASLARMGVRLASLRAVVDALDGAMPVAAVDRCVAITCDDGTIFDWEDAEHPFHGPQASFANLVSEHGARCAVPPVALTSFVIASREARAEIDHGCYLGYPFSSDAWWSEAARSGQVAIENHSWDHAHASVSRIAQREQRKGTFLGIDNFDDAQAQVGRAADFIDEHVGIGQTTLFAYPYGEVPPYLADEYFPRFRHLHRVRAAITDRPGVVTEGSDRWRLPRFVCGKHWRTSEGFEALIKDAVGEGAA